MVPEILTVGDSVTFCLNVPSEEARLLIRCDPDGTITASLEFGMTGSHP
jgi:hypothetical protein